MNHNQALLLFEEYFAGTLDDSRQNAMTEHTAHCEECRTALSEFEEILSLESLLSEHKEQAPERIETAVMGILAKRAEQALPSVRSRLVSRFFWLIGFPFLGLLFLVVAALMTTPLQDPDLPLSRFADTLMKLIEGALGALMMVATGVVGVFLLIKSGRSQRLAPAGGMLTLALAMFVLRASTTLFYGTEYADYDRGYSSNGGGPSGSYSEAQFDDTLIRSLRSRAKRAISPRGEASERVISGYARPFRSLARPMEPTPDYASNFSSMSVPAEPARNISTFSIDVDTGSYTRARALLRSGLIPPTGEIRTEEFLNYFTYRYPEPSAGRFAVSYEIGNSPWKKNEKLLRVGLRSASASRGLETGRSYVFLIDVSGSMADETKLPLLKQSLNLLIDQLTDRDRIALVTYADGSSLVLDSTPGSQKATIRAALDRLNAHGGTNGGEGIRTAYRVANSNKIEGGINRVILATDGDFNVGVVDPSSLRALIESAREGGVHLTTLGFGINGMNETNLEQLANRGNGNYFFLDSLEEARKVLMTNLSANTEVSAQDTKIQIEFNPAFVKSAKLVGYDNRVLEKEDFRDNSVDAGEAGSGQTVTALYEIELTENAQTATATSTSPRETEIGVLQIRYKTQEAGAASFPREEQFPIAKSLLSSNSESDDFQLAVAAATFGELLRGRSIQHEIVKEIIAKSKSPELEELFQRNTNLRGGSGTPLPRY